MKSRISLMLVFVMWLLIPIHAWGYEYVMLHEMTPRQFLKDHNHWIRQGFELKDIGGYVKRNKEVYAALWHKPAQESVKGRVIKIGMTSRELLQESNKRRRQGYSIIKLGSFTLNGNVQHFAEWEKKSRRDSLLRDQMHESEYLKAAAKNERLGLRLTWINVHNDKGTTRFTAIWTKQRGPRQHIRHNLTADALQKELRQMSKIGFRLHLLKGYGSGNTTRYFAMWQQSSGPPQIIKHKISSKNFPGIFNNAYYTGRTPVALSAFPIGKTSQFSLVFEGGSFSYETDAEISELVSTLMTELSIPGLALAITKDERLVYARGYGYSDKDTSWFTSPTHLFRIASVSKAITGTTVMKLIEMGLLDLDDKVFGEDGILGFDYGYPPINPVEKVTLNSGSGTKVVVAGEPVNQLHNVTVRHLLEHTTGDWPNDKDDPIHQQLALNAAQLIEWVLDKQNHQLSTTPGLKVDYSNFGYVLLGRIIEKVTKNLDTTKLGDNPTYENVAKKYVLKPVGITDMHIGGTKKNERRANEVVYYPYPGIDKFPYKYPFRRKDASGSWIASPIDLARFLVRVDALPSKPDLLTSGNMKTMISPSKSGAQYGKGWFLPDASKCSTSLNGKKCKWLKSGGFSGTSALVYRRPNGISWVIVINTRPEGVGNVNNIFTDLFLEIENAIGDNWPTYDLF